MDQKKICIPEENEGCISLPKKNTVNEQAKNIVVKF